MKLKKRGIGAVGFLTVLVVLAGCGSENTASYDLGSGAGGTGLTESFESPVNMGVGDIMPVEFFEGKAMLDFAGVPTTSDFVLVLGNAAKGGVGTTIQLSTDISPALEAKALLSVDAGVSDEEELTADELVSHWMRAFEYDFAMTAPLPAKDRAGKAFAVRSAPDVGSVREFRMLNSLSSAVSYVSVRGQLTCIGDNVLFYVDTRVTNELTLDEVNELCTNFDEDIAKEQSLYGSLSDVDDNDMIIVFASPQVNLLGNMGGGIITGYFYAGDLYDRNSSNPVSNVGEIIYTMIPDSNGKWGVPVANDFAMENLIPAVLVHEAQHAISYNQHVFVNGGMPEEPWLNEALSHFTEDIMGYGRENPSRVSMFLANTAMAGLVTSSTPNLMERGASYLFMRFLYEQHPDPQAFLRRLQDTDLTGVDNLQQAYAGEAGFQSFSQFMARWALALVMTGRGLTTDPRYTYEERTRHPETGNWEGVCLNCEAEDGRGTVLNGVKLAPYYGYHAPTIDSSALTYFEITTVPDEIVLEAGGSDGAFGVLIRTN